MPFNYEAASTLAAMLEIGFDNQRLALQVGEQFTESINSDPMPEVRNLFFSALISFWFHKRQLTLACLNLISVMKKNQTQIGSIDFKREAKELLELLEKKNSLRFTRKSVKICKIIFSEMKNHA